MDRNTPRVARLVGAAGALALLVVLLAPGPSAAIDATSGTCALELEATVSGDTITFQTVSPADGGLVNACLLETGILATGDLSGSFSALALSFECYEAVGAGHGTFGYTPSSGPGNQWSNMTMRAAKVGDGIEIVLNHVGTDFIFTGVGQFVQTTPSAEVCLTARDPLRWVGSFTWEDPVFE